MCKDVGRLVRLRSSCDGRLRPSASNASVALTEADDDEDDIVGVDGGVENVSLSGESVESCAGATEIVLRALSIFELSGIGLLDIIVRSMLSRMCIAQLVQVRISMMNWPASEFLVREFERKMVYGT